MLLLYVIQWLHVLCAIFWLGGALYGNFVVIPAIGSLPLELQRKVAKPLGSLGNKAMISTALLVIVFGLLRGTLFGPVQSLSFLVGTAYGITFLISFVVALGTLAWGVFVMGRTFERLNNIPLEEMLLADGTLSPSSAALVQQAKLFALLELLGFLVVFSCMILMRFGL
ncbi:hypothetical protein KSD_70150 [Ktedonobacter sp. SOSP1-85]|uniref:hypothetical protein n=1 Tax=Ktedonobacter sp. SOSP1-85 TaxID=2778367 RepID=UPI001915B5C6|nr:hypothetical protein [Ktedonobacter sp. SOSP1-85]GHO79244.1 hypothetical protein KSD_70150 [Ktedonobacter sp. SOSP1-85]